MSIADLDLDAVDWSEWRDDPAPLYRILRDEHPVFYDAPRHMYLFTRYADVDVLLKDTQRFSNTPLVLVDHERVSPLLQEDPPRHGFLRKIVMPLFTPREMRRLDTYFRDVARELLDAAERTEVVEISSALAVTLPGRVTCDLLGVPLDEHHRFLKLTAERLGLLYVTDGRIIDDGTHRSLQEIRDDLWSIVGPVVESRRRAPQHDAITFLVQAQHEHGEAEISDWLIIDMLLHLLTGGFHTTQHLIESLVNLLADRPDLWQRLRDDRSLVPKAIEEMLRLDAPVQALRRRAIEPVEMHGVMLPVNASIATVFGSANLDERVFEDPETFSLDRDATRHIAFGAGLHYCASAGRRDARPLLIHHPGRPVRARAGDQPRRRGDARISQCARHAASCRLKPQETRPWRFTKDPSQISGV
jgi:cytochrome P450